MAKAQQTRTSPEGSEARRQTAVDRCLATTSDGRPIARNRRARPDRAAADMPLLGRRFAVPGMIVDLNSAQPFSANFDCPDLTFSLQLGRREFEVGFDTDKLSPLRLAPGTVSLSPKGSSVRARSGSVDSAFLAFCLAEDRVAQALEACGMTPADLRVAPQVQHPDILPLAQALQSFVKRPEARVAAYGEALVQAILLSMLTAVGGSRAVKPGCLKQQQIDEIRDFIEANLASQLTVSDLAGLIGANAYQFSADFKRATGAEPLPVHTRPPHQPRRGHADLQRSQPRRHRLSRRLFQPVEHDRRLPRPPRHNPRRREVWVKNSNQQRNNPLSIIRDRDDRSAVLAPMPSTGLRSAPTSSGAHLPGSTQPLKP